MPPPDAHRANGSPSDESHEGTQVSSACTVRVLSACTTKDYGPPDDAASDSGLWFTCRTVTDATNNMGEKRKCRTNVEDETELDVSSPPDTPPRIRQKALQMAFAEAAPRVRRGNFAFAEPAPPLPEADVEWSAVREIVEALKKKPGGREVVWRLESELE